MLVLSAKTRKIIGKKSKNLRKQGLLPAVLYGPEIKNLSLVVDLKKFEQVLKEAGESSLIKLKVDNQAEDRNKKREFLVLIHDVQVDPLTEKPIHVDFYQPKLREKVEAVVPLVFEGEAPAVKELGGVLVKNMTEIEVKGLPQDLPKEIKIDVSGLKTFEDVVKVGDFKLAPGIEVLKEAEEVVVLVTPPEKEELEKPVEEEASVKEVKEEKKGGDEKGDKKTDETERRKEGVDS